MFPSPYVPLLMLLVPMFPNPFGTQNVSSPITPQTYITQSLFSPVPMFSLIPSAYISQYLCSPVSMLPGLDAPQSLCSQSLCSPVPMPPPPVTVFPKSYPPHPTSPSHDSPIPRKCLPLPMFPKHVSQSLCSPKVSRCSYAPKSLSGSSPGLVHLTKSTWRQMKTTAETRPEITIGFRNNDVSQTYAEADNTHSMRMDTNSAEITVPITSCV